MPPLNKAVVSVALINDFLLDIRRGGYPDKELLRVEGRNPDVDDTANAIWEQGGVYNFSTGGKAYSVSSSENADTQNVEIIILLTDFTKAIYNVTLTGRTKLVFHAPTTGHRVLSIRNTGTSIFAGDVYIYEDSAITAGVPDDLTLVRAFVENTVNVLGFNRSRMAITTIEAGVTAYLMSTFSNVGGNIDVQVRLEGKVFISYDSLVPIPEKSDVMIVATSPSGDVEIIAGFDILKINNV